MKELRERIATENAKAEKMEAETMDNLFHLKSQIGKYEGMKSRCEDLTEDIEKSLKKVIILRYSFGSAHGNYESLIRLFVYLF